MRWRYTKGLHDLGGGSFAWLQPDGSWGWSNAGLVTDGEASLLVDTLFDLSLTGEMLAAMRDATPLGLLKEEAWQERQEEQAGRLRSQRAPQVLDFGGERPW